MLGDISGLTISYNDFMKSDELLIHMNCGRDHRYHCGKLRDTIAALLVYLKSFQSSSDRIQKSKGEQENLWLYKVGNVNLKTYCTSKVEASKG